MHTCVLTLLLLLIAADTSRLDHPLLPLFALPPWAVWLLVFLPLIVMLNVQRMAVKRVVSRLAKDRSGRGPRRVARLGSVMQIGILLLFAFDLLLGWPDVVRRVTGDVIGLDEWLIMTPSLLALIGLHAVRFPLERRLQESWLMRRLDEGKPIAPLLTFERHVTDFFRTQAGLVLLPLFLLSSVSEAALTHAPERYAQGFALGGAVAVMIFAPLFLRWMWRVTPMPQGDIRDTLTGLCKQYRVRVSQILLWQTDGRIVNAAVVGLAPFLRYLILSDGVLEGMPRTQVEAVMAHELGHLKLRHMPWLLITAVGLLGVAGVLADTVSPWFTQRMPWVFVRDWGWVVGWAVMIFAWFLAFGWVMRRIERQADTFAVKHFSKSNVIDADAVHAMSDALGNVATLNGIPLKRHDWRHGSIAFRRTYLATLVGQRCDNLAIDRQMRGVRFVALACFILAIATMF